MSMREGGRGVGVGPGVSTSPPYSNAPISQIVPTGRGTRAGPCRGTGRCPRIDRGAGGGQRVSERLAAVRGQRQNLGSPLGSARPRYRRCRYCGQEVADPDPYSSEQFSPRVPRQESVAVVKLPGLTTRCNLCFRPQWVLKRHRPCPDAGDAAGLSVVAANRALMTVTFAASMPVPPYTA
jgi:hypothetical protein